MGKIHFKLNLTELAFLTTLKSLHISCKFQQKLMLGTKQYGSKITPNVSFSLISIHILRKGELRPIILEIVGKSFYFVLELLTGTVDNNWLVA